MRETKKSTAEAEEAKAGAAATATAQRQKERSEKKKEQQQREKNKTTTTTTSEIKKIKKKKNKNKKRNESSSSSSFVQRHVVVPITDVFRAIKSMNYRQLTLQLLSLTLIVTSALMIWKSLCLYTHSESPVVVVLSGSMEPAFKRGDILFLSLKKKEKKTNKRMSFSNNSNSIVGGGGDAATTTTTTKKKKKNEEEEEERGEEERTRVGEIIVFSIDGREIPIVHRVIKSHYHPYSTASLSSSSSSSSSQSSFDKADDDSSASSGSIGSGSGSSYDDSDRDDENSSLSSPSPSFKHEMLTKGDNNYMDDIGLYAPGQKWLNEKHVMGRTVGYLPHVGKATILMNDHPMIKYALILVLGLLVISGKEG